MINDPKYYALRQGIETGFINETYVSNDLFQPELLINDGRDKTVAMTIREQLQECDGFCFSVAFITTSGLACLKQQLIELEKKGIQGKILTSQYLNFTQPEALRHLLKFKNLELRIAVDDNFHAKGYLFSKADTYNLIIGSSNCTNNALMRNKEWNLKVSTSKQGAISSLVFSEFEHDFARAQIVTDAFIEKYQLVYDWQKQVLNKVKDTTNQDATFAIKPNQMQKEALKNLNALRDRGETKGLLISATGTGKTYLSAFDAFNVNPKRLLFVVHRTNIAKAAMQTYQRIFKNKKSLGLYSGGHTQEKEDFIFSTIQTISRDEHLHRFSRDAFDYIIIDETHRASAGSYQKIIDYFTPQFLLGMTATPERTDGDDIFKIFDHNIAYEIRLKQALQMNILSPFHYYGVTDICVNDELIEEDASFNDLVQDARIQHIIDKINLYGCDSGSIRGLVFCSNIKECEVLAEKFTQLNYRSIALTSKDAEEKRERAITCLESDNLEEKIDFIFSVGIFNEGIDIPSVNLVVMLRPTESAIIFVQQLGRGLRKAINKEYLTVIDFIGNYKNNFLVPIALYGDTSYNKDNIRKLMAKNGGCIEGASTIDFDPIAKEQIYTAIDGSNLQLKKDLTHDYKMMKFKLGRKPMMMDFLEYGARDPYAYVKYSKSFFSFAKGNEKSLIDKLTEKEEKVLQLFSIEINNAKRVGESIVLSMLLQDGEIQIQQLKLFFQNEYAYELTDITITSLIHNLNFYFVTERLDGKTKTVNEIYDLDVISCSKDSLSFHSSFKPYLNNTVFTDYLKDATNYSMSKYNQNYKANEFYDGFLLYQKYSRKDVFRILEWTQNPIAQNVGGYIVSSDKKNCPIFVTYEKEENIAETINYKDYFISESKFHWMSKSRRNLNSPDIQTIMNYRRGLRLPFFVKKSNDEGAEFYYMGDVIPQDNSFHLTNMPTSKGNVSVVEVIFTMGTPVKNNMYRYLLNK